MNITTLGSGAWEGIPAPFCTCTVCTLAVQDPSSKNNRTRPEFLVENDGGAFLMELSPDIRLQSSRQNLSKIRDVFVSHWHFDHMIGLRELHAWVKRIPEPFTVYCSEGTADMLKKEYAYIPFKTAVLRPFEQVKLFGVTVTPLPVYHMFTQDEAVPEDQIANTFAYLCETNDMRFVYLADYYRVPQSTIDRIQGLDVVIADGTYLSNLNYKDIRPNHLHAEDIIRFTQNLNAKKTYYHSISHLTQKTHEELQQALPENHFLTFDGMRVA